MPILATKTEFHRPRKSITTAPLRPRCDVIPPTSSRVTRIQIFFEGKNGVFLSLSFQCAIVRVCTTRKSCYVQKHSFLASAHFPCRLEEINMDVCLKGRLMRVSPASYGSQSWVGCYQGCTGGVGGQGAENWCVDEARKRAR